MTMTFDTLDLFQASRCENIEFDTTVTRNPDFKQVADT